MDDIEERKKFIYERLGEKGLEILRKAGIDIDAGVIAILEEQKEESERLSLAAGTPTLRDYMTSELVHRSLIPDEVLGKEYARRLRLIGLSDEQIQSLYYQESLISATGSLREQKEQPWVRRYFIFPSSTPETMPKPEELTLSELILITDDATSAYFRDHHIASGEAWQAICIAAGIVEHTEARYAKAFKERVKGLGWSEAQDLAYTRNECLLTERLKWGMHGDQAWTEETTDLKKYGD